MTTVKGPNYYRNQRNRERKERNKRIFNEGKTAAAAGKGLGACPREYVQNMARFHWEKGWWEERNKQLEHEAELEMFGSTRDWK